MRLARTTRLRGFAGVAGAAVAAVAVLATDYTVAVERDKSTAVTKAPEPKPQTPP